MARESLLRGLVKSAIKNNLFIGVQNKPRGQGTGIVIATNCEEGTGRMLEEEIGGHWLNGDTHKSWVMHDQEAADFIPELVSHLKRGGIIAITKAGYAESALQVWNENLRNS